MPTMPRKAFDKALTPFYDWLQGKGTNGALPAVTGLSVSHDGVGDYRKTTLRFTDVAVAAVDSAGVVARATLKVYDLPDGMINFFGARASLVITKSSAGIIDTFDGDIALGTVAAAGDATLTSTEANLIPSTATPQAVAGASTVLAVSTGTEALKTLDGTGTAIDVYLNFLIDDTDHDVTTTPANVIFNGTVELYWMNLGDK